MLNMDQKLIKRQEEGKIIKTGIVGAGQMGRGMVTQMVLMNGITPAIVSDIKVENAVHAFKYAGVSDEDIVVAKTLADANAAMEAGKYVACEDANFVSQANLVECAIDATGVPDVGAKVATDAMKNKKHVVMLNVETDVVIGPYLKKLAQKEGVIYTGSAGDEPGAVMELYSFAKAMGMNVEVMGKGKNNKIDYECNPDTVLEEATRRVMSPKMLCAFKDGTKTMVEMTAMSNYTGLIPDVIGGHGPKTAPGTEGVKELNDIFKLKEEHQKTLAQVQNDNQSLISQLQDENRKQIDRMQAEKNEAVTAATNEIKASYDKLKVESKAEYDKLKADDKNVFDKMAQEKDKKISELQTEIVKKDKELTKSNSKIEGLQSEVTDLRNYQPEEPKEYAYYYNEVIPRLSAGLGFTGESVPAKIALSLVGVVVSVLAGVLIVIS